MDTTDEILAALRRIIRAIDLRSKELVRSHGLTGPQALLLKEATASGPLSVGDLAKRATLSQATVTDILARLEKRGLVTRRKSRQDRRRVVVSVTAQGQELARTAPPLLQERFVERLAKLQYWEQTQILSSLQRVAAMMDAEQIDAAPVLISGAIEPAPPEVEPKDPSEVDAAG